MATGLRMVPNIAHNGSSFRGAGAYHLHDKPIPGEVRPRTAARVAFTATRNLANEDPHAALHEMWRTAEDAAYLKAAAGTRPTGRRNATPVKTMSLAWAPGETPSRDEMTAAGDDFLRAMGWHQHQALYVAHSDTAHPHLHIILNRVHPHTGRTLSDWQERKRAQRWALAYERRQGAVLCKGRALRYQRGAPPAPAGLPYRQARLLASYPDTDRTAVARAHRAEGRAAWSRHYRRERAVLAQLARQRRSVQQHAVSLAREGDAAAATRLLDGFEKRHARATRSLSRLRHSLAQAQYATLATRLRHARDPSRRAANDNPAAAARSQPTHTQHSGLRYQKLLLRRQEPTINVRTLAAQQRSERQQLRAFHAAALAALRQRGTARRQAVALAHSEIALAFAARWAAIEAMPAALRASAIAALKAEQAAALSARLAHHLSRIHPERRTALLALSSLHRAERRALAHRHRLARATIKRSRPARASPTGRAGPRSALTGSPLHA